MADFLKFLNDDTYAEFKAAGGDIAKLSDKAYNEVKLASKVANPVKAPEEKVNPLLSFAQGAASNASLGFDDELGGAATAVVKDVGSVFGLSKGGDYEHERDKIRDSKEALEKANPKSYMAGGLTTGVATAAVTGGGSIAAQAGRAGAEGAVRSIGNADEIGEKSLSEAVKTGVIDAATAGTLAKVMPGITAKLGEMADGGAAFLKKVANSRAVKTLGGTKGQYENLGEAKVQEIGEMLLENKVVTPLASSKTMHGRLESQIEDNATKMAPIYKESSGARVDADELGALIRDRAEELGADAGTVRFGEQVGRYADDVDKASAKFKNRGVKDYIDEGGDLDDALSSVKQQSYNPSDIRKFRQNVQKSVNYNSDAASQEGAKDVRNILREKEMSLIEGVDPKLREANERLFKDQHLSLSAEELAEKGVSKAATNADLGLNTWQAIQATAAASSSGVLAVAAGAAKEFGKRYGNQMSATALARISKAMTNEKFAGVFAKAAEKGPAAVAATHSVLLQNPEYKKLIGDE